MRVSIRLLAASVAVLAGVFAFLGNEYRNRRDAFATIAQNGGEIYFETMPSDAWRLKADRAKFDGLIPFELSLNVRSIRFGGGIEIGGKVLNEQVLAAIADLREAREIVLIGYDISEADCESIAKSPQVASLSLFRCRIAPGALKPFAEIETLTSLNLGFSSIAIRDCASLGNCQSLTEIALHGSDVTDQGLLFIAKAKKLSDVSLSGDLVTTKGIEKLLSMRALSSLQYSGPEFSEEWWARIKIENPNCKIIR